MRRALGMLSIGTLLIAATPTAFGGWTVITVQELPEYLVAGQPTTLQFMVRQHGRTLMDDRDPTVTMETVGKEKGMLRAVFTGRNRVDARRVTGSAVYQASVVAGDTGAVVITIDADWYGSHVKLLPLQVVAAGQAPAALSAPQIGRHLFVAKGCVTCHVKRDDPEVLERGQLSVGPELTGRAFAADWLAQKLADPAKNRVRFSEYAEMPNLGLATGEIAALVSYINERRETVAAGSGN